MSATTKDVTLRARLEARKRAQGPPQKEADDTVQVARRLFSYMAGGENSGRFLVALIFRVVGIAGLVAIPYFTGEAINVVTEGGAVDELSRLIVLALISTAIYYVLSVIAERVFSQLATTGLYKLQRHLFEHIQTLSLTFFDRQPLGELMSRVTNDTETVAIFYENAVAPLIRSIFQVIIILLVMLLVDVQLTLVAVLIIPLILASTFAVQRVATPAFTKLQEEVGILSGFQEETITGQKVISANRRQEWASDKNAFMSGGVFEIGSQAFFASIVQFPLTSGITTFGIVLVLVSGAFMVMNGATTLGVVVAFMTYVSLLASPLSDIANQTATTLNAVAGGRRVFSIIDEQPVVVDVPNAADYVFKGGDVRFDDVDFSYVPGRKILRHNTFEAKPGQKIGICGPTGAGKSTIINILTRYYDLDSGTIYIDGQDISQLTQVSLRRQISAVLQEAFLFSETVMNNLKYAREGATDEECIQAAKEANAHEFIEHLPQGYDTMMTERGANLSQGQRQMITIARAMVANPKILILDEATSNVDTRTEQLIQEGLQRLMSGRTSFVIAHRLSTIRDSHHIMVVNGGEIVEFGPHDELMAQKGFYYALYMSQFKGKAPGGAEASDVDFIST